MNNHIDSAPTSSWSGNPIASGAPGTAGTVDSSMQPDVSQQVDIEDWEDEGGSVPPSSASSVSDSQPGSAWHHADATDRLPPWLVF